MREAKSWQKLQKKVLTCMLCPDLRDYALDIATSGRRRAYSTQQYWGKPVPAFGEPTSRIALVGLAPGAHGSNRTGRMFTGDSSGDFLYPALYRAGLSSQPKATDSKDGMLLRDCVITAAARCAPPQNKPSGRHLSNCLPFLIAEFHLLSELRVAIGLGKIGFDAIVKALRALGYQFSGGKNPKFSHGCEYIAVLGDRAIALVGCYHPSRQNTNTGVLTPEMLDQVLQRAVEIARGD